MAAGARNHVAQAQDFGVKKTAWSPLATHEDCPSSFVVVPQSLRNIFNDRAREWG
jgi:hypothetical protein